MFVLQQKRKEKIREGKPEQRLDFTCSSSNGCGGTLLHNGMFHVGNQLHG